MAGDGSPLRLYAERNARLLTAFANNLMETGSDEIILQCSRRTHLFVYGSFDELVDDLRTFLIPRPHAGNDYANLTHPDFLLLVSMAYGGLKLQFAAGDELYRFAEPPGDKGGCTVTTFWLQADGEPAVRVTL